MMSQIYKQQKYSPDVLLLRMVANGTTTASGSAYDLEIGDDSVFAVEGTRGTSIELDSSNDKKLNLAAGLYELNFNGWVQTSSAVTGSLDYLLQVSTNAAFITTDISYDRLILQYDGVTAVVDPSHTVVFNVPVPQSVYFRITLNSGSTWYLRGDAISSLTNLQIRRISEAI